MHIHFQAQGAGDQCVSIAALMYKIPLRASARGRRWYHHYMQCKGNPFTMSYNAGRVIFKFIIVDAASREIIPRRVSRLLINDELERIWKETVVV
jgi:hypothetical protein